MENKNYTCSSTYSDLLLSLRLCPFKVDSCGDTDAVSFDKTGASWTLTQKLYPGDICFYAAHAECGVPSFAPSGTDVSDLDIYTLQYDDNEM